MVTMMSKQDALTGRLSLRVFPEIMDAVDLETMRLRREGLRFDKRKAKQTVIVMTAIEEFLSLPEDVRNKLYLKRVAEYEKKLLKPQSPGFGVPGSAIASN